MRRRVDAPCARRRSQRLRRARMGRHADASLDRRQSTQTLAKSGRVNARLSLRESSWAASGERGYSPDAPPASLPARPFSRALHGWRIGSPAWTRPDLVGDTRCFCVPLTRPCDCSCPSLRVARAAPVVGSPLGAARFAPRSAPHVNSTSARSGADLRRHACGPACGRALKRLEALKNCVSRGPCSRPGGHYCPQLATVRFNLLRQTFCPFSKRRIALAHALATGPAASETERLSAPVGQQGRRGALAMRPLLVLCLAVAFVCANPVQLEQRSRGRSRERKPKRAAASNGGWDGTTSNVQRGKTGVSAMQLTVVGSVCSPRPR